MLGPQLKRMTNAMAKSIQRTGSSWKDRKNCVAAKATADCRFMCSLGAARRHKVVIDGVRVALPGVRHDGAVAVRNGVAAGRHRERGIEDAQEVKRPGAAHGKPAREHEVAHLNAV